MPRTFDLKKILAPVEDIVRQLNARRSELLEEVGLIEGELARFGENGRSKNGRRGDHMTAPAGQSGRRKRRGREEIEATANEVVEFIKAAGKDGLTGREIKAKYGALLPSTKKWLSIYAPSAKIKTTGAKASMRYHLS